MAKAGKPNLAPWVVFIVLAVVASGAAWWFLRGGGGSGAGPASAVAAPTLPTGGLQYAGMNVSEAHYLLSGDLKRSGRAAQATVLVVGKTATAIAHQYALVAKHETLDCAGRTIAQEIAGEYDQAGQLKNTEFLTGPAGRPMESSDFEAAAICDGKPGPAWRGAAGWRAAQRQMQTPPEAITAAAEANSKDADAWAWLCHGAPQRWRKQSPQDCDHAVSLQPAAASVRLDRAYLNMAIGRTGPAGADFREILAHDPDNASALFGRSLVEALGGDKAASKRDRDRALELDPKVPDWVETTFRFQISDPYRGR